MKLMATGCLLMLFAIPSFIGWPVAYPDVLAEWSRFAFPVGFLIVLFARARK